MAFEITHTHTHTHTHTYIYIYIYIYIYVIAVQDVEMPVSYTESVYYMRHAFPLRNDKTPVDLGCASFLCFRVH